MTAPLEMLKPTDAARYLNIGKTSFYKLVKNRLIRPTRPQRGSRLVRYSRAELERYVMNHTRDVG